MKKCEKLYRILRDYCEFNNRESCDFEQDFFKYYFKGSYDDLTINKEQVIDFLSHVIDDCDIELEWNKLQKFVENNEFKIEEFE